MKAALQKLEEIKEKVPPLNNLVTPLLQRMEHLITQEKNLQWIKMKLNAIGNENITQQDFLATIEEIIIGFLEPTSIPGEELDSIDLDYDYDEEDSDNILHLNIGGKRMDLMREIFLKEAKETFGETIFVWLGRKRWRSFLKRDKDGRIYLDWEPSWVQPIINLFLDYSPVATSCAQRIPIVSQPLHLLDQDIFFDGLRAILTNYCSKPLNNSFRYPNSDLVL